jgi:copper chaperone CopZ
METTLIIQNLKCGGCAKTIMTKLSEISGISNAEVNIDNSAISFHYKSEDVLSSVKEMLLSLGYPIEGEANSVLSKAKSFVSCATGRLSKS